jgi:hypothetical protein
MGIKEWIDSIKIDVDVQRHTRGSLDRSLYCLCQQKKPLDCSKFEFVVRFTAKSFRHSLRIAGRDFSSSPAGVWCERVVRPAQADALNGICPRRRCPHSPSQTS